MIKKYNLTSVWVFCLFFAAPLSAFALNGLAIIGAMVTLFKKKTFYTFIINPYIQYILFIIFFFYISNYIHLQTQSSIANYLTMFLLMYFVGDSLSQKYLDFIPYVLIALFMGTAMSTSIYLYTNPNAPLWATISLGNGNGAAIFALIAFPLLFKLKLKWQVLFFFPLIIFLIMTGSRSVMLGLCIGLLFYGVFHLNIRQKIVTSIISILFLFTLFIIHQYSPSLQRLIPIQVEQARVDLNILAFKVSQNNHFYGIGERDISLNDIPKDMSWQPKHAYVQKIIEQLKEGNHVNVSFHNRFSSILVYYGVLGVLLILIFYLLPFIWLWKKDKTQEVLLILSLWVAFFIYSLFESGLHNITSIMLGLITGLFSLFHHKKVQHHE